MPKRTRAYGSWRDEKLSNPEIASEYLNEALGESPEVFLAALRNVAQAHQMKKVAEASGVARESLYRALSSEGNPRLGTLDSVLDTLGLELLVTPKRPAASTRSISPRPAPRSRKKKHAI